MPVSCICVYTPLYRSRSHRSTIHVFPPATPAGEEEQGGILLYYAYRPLGSEERREGVARWYEEEGAGKRFLSCCFWGF